LNVFVFVLSFSFVFVLSFSFLFIFIKMNAISKELTDTQMQTLCPGCPITEYGRLAETPATAALGPQGTGFLFFTEKNTPEVSIGHWLGMIRTGNSIEVFDPYGAKPGGDPWYLDHTFVSPQSLIALKESAPIVRQWAMRNNLTPTFNPYKYQQMKNGINTCGRHCCVRVKNADMSESEYHAYIQQLCRTYRCSPDQLVTAMTKHVS